MQKYEEQQVQEGVGSVIPSFGDGAKEKLSELRQKLVSALDKDTKRMQNGINHLLNKANLVPTKGTRDILEYRLQQYSGLRAKLQLSHLAACLVSSKAKEDILNFNPYVENDGITVSKILTGTASVVFVAIRISQLRRAIIAIDGVVSAINEKIDAKKMRRKLIILQ